MTALAPTLEAFFTDRLVRQRNASPHTVAAYRDTFVLLLGYAQARTGKDPSQLDVADLDAALIGAFLCHLEDDRHNSVRTRNARLGAIHSLFRYASLRHPEHAALITQVLAIPNKRHERALVTYLTGAETDALLGAPDQASWLGRRDHALLLVAIQCGLRVSELATLTCGDVRLGTGAHVRCHGKGRKERITPLTASTVAVLRGWLDERRGQPPDPLFPTSRGTPLSRDAIAKLVAKHAATARAGCPSLTTKAVSPHTLRHSCAMSLLTAGVDTSVIALWLGHEQPGTTQIYLHADLGIKERALARTAPLNAMPGRYRPSDPLLAFLEGL
jgi:site-specific recombinase XerD